MLFLLTVCIVKWMISGEQDELLCLAPSDKNEAWQLFSFSYFICMNIWQRDYYYSY